MRHFLLLLFLMVLGVSACGGPATTQQPPATAEGPTPTVEAAESPEPSATDTVLATSEPSPAATSPVEATTESELSPTAQPGLSPTTERTTDHDGVTGEVTCDRLNQLSWTLPEKWYAIVPQQGVAGTSTLHNYDPSSPPGTGLQGEFTPEMVKIDLMKRPLEGESLEEMVEALRNQVAFPYGPEGTESALTMTEPVTIAGLSGYQFEADPDEPTGLRLIVLDSGEDDPIVATIRPANSNYMDDALAILETLELGSCE